MAWPHCDLPTLSPSLDAVHPGDALTISAGPIHCDRQTLPSPSAYTLTLLTKTGPVAAGTYPLEKDTSFHATLTVPQVEPERGAFIKVTGGPADLPRPDAAACLAYGFTITILEE